MHRDIEQKYIFRIQIQTGRQTDLQYGQIYRQSTHYELICYGSHEGIKNVKKQPESLCSENIMQFTTPR